MASKTDWKHILIEQGLGFLGDGVKNLYENVIVRMNEYMDETQKRIEDFLIKVTKATILLTIFLLGVVFILVGASQYLTAYFGEAGTGYVLVGFCLLFLAFLVRLLK